MNTLKRARSLVTGDGLKARLIRGAVGSGGVQAANRFLALALSVVLARMLGPDYYGVYAYAFAIMSLLMMLAEVGVPPLLMREVAASQGRAEWGVLRGAIRRGAQFVALAASMVSMTGLLVLWWFADSLRAEVVCTTALMLLVLPATALCKTVAHAIRGLNRVVIGQAVDMLIRPLVVLIIVAVVFIAFPERRQPHIAMTGQLSGALLVLLVGMLTLRCLMPSESRGSTLQYRSRQWLKSALPFTLIGGAGIINTQADIIMIGWFMPTEEIGQYRVAAQAAMLIPFGLQAASAVIAPQFSRLYAQGDMLRLRRLVVISRRISLAAALPLAIALFIAGDVIVEWVFGPAYSGAHLPLVILAVGQLVNAAFGPVGIFLNMTGNEKLNSMLLWSTVAGNIVMNSVMIPIAGISGAALASSLSLAFKNFAQLLLAKRVIATSRERQNFRRV
jgi:O-antigen/teichoic acid export membrane protein